MDKGSECCENTLSDVEKALASDKRKPKLKLQGRNIKGDKVVAEETDKKRNE